MMRGYKTVLTVVCVFAVALGAGFLGYSVTLNRIQARAVPPEPTAAAPVVMIQSEASPTPMPAPTPQPTPNTLPQYLILENEDARIDVFILAGGELTYIKTIDYDCGLLRADDRAMLKNGIYLNSEEEAAMLIEDFIS